MLKKLFKISCRKATFLASKKEAGKTSFWENLTLKLHYKICDGCNLFEKQTSAICKNAKNIHEHTDIVMRSPKKREIKELMRNIKVILAILLPVA
jgi:hypothetical protein